MIEPTNRASETPQMELLTEDDYERAVDLLEDLHELIHLGVIVARRRPDGQLGYAIADDLAPLLNECPAA